MAAATTMSAATGLRLERGTGSVLRSSSKHHAQLAQLQARMPATRPQASNRGGALTCVMMAGEKKKILMMGGTRFIGLYLARMLVEEGHEVTLFTRGKQPIAQQIPDDTDASFEKYSRSIKHLKGDRKDSAAVKDALSKNKFDIVYDINGANTIVPLSKLHNLPGAKQKRQSLSLRRFLTLSTGVYLKSDEMPHFEVDAVDPKSRHVGKLDTESYLSSAGVTWTSVRPVYIYGPLNYNPVEEWFFHRIAAKRPIPVPNSGLQITQLGHVKDLARAFVLTLGNSKAYNQVYNISGDKYVTFSGIARACAEAAGAPPPELVHYNPKEYDFGKAKAFPLRDQHFFTSIEKAKKDLDWAPEFDLIAGLKDSYEKDFGRGTFRKAADFTADDMILAKVKGLAAV
eukprot:jgi/Chlat1/1464/Chrsp12S02069